jgi:hypothetical protein
MADAPKKKKAWIKKTAGGHLTASDRQALPKTDFALPGQGAGPNGAGSGSYPIPDASHGRNALSRVSANGTPAEKATVSAAVHRKFPGIGEKSRAEKMYRGKKVGRG